MKNYFNQTSVINNTLLLQGDIWCVDCRQLLCAREMELISDFPEISSDEIDNMNDGNFFVNVVAVFQIGHFLLELATRFAFGVCITQVEIVTLTLAAATIVTYILWWDKPQNMKTSITIFAKHRPSHKQFREMVEHGPRQILPSWLCHLVTPASSGFGISNFAIHCANDIGKDSLLFVLSVGVCAVLISLGFFLGWNSSFGHDTLRYIWRVVTIVLFMIMPVLGIIILNILPRITCLGFNGKRRRAQVVVGLLFAVLVGGRIILAVVAVINLWYLPPNAFQSTWTSNLPHIS
ncbi:uncharacterized protein VB005_08149 [Metarhizium brunneum]